MKYAPLAAVAAATALLASVAWAHTVLENSNPASGSVLNASPKEIVLTFKEPTRMAAVTLMNATDKDRRLTVTTQGAAKSVVIADPRLGPGRNAVHWRAVSGDGHAVEGEVILVLRAAP